ncbi:MAG: phosphoribosyl-AMP cyclohydrolase [Chloroflexota bacterium]|nr:phosphoribosyl-AMP cyclohydrolase [Chloroflexota bacterium]
MSPETLPREAITTARLRLEPSVGEHIARKFAVMKASQEEFRRWFWWAQDLDLNAYVQFESDYQASWNRGVYGYTIFLGDDVIGDVSLRLGVSATGHQADIGYWMGTAWSGNGYMTEAAEALRDLAFDRLGLLRLELVCGVENAGSRRVAEKLGMRREGFMRSGGYLTPGYAYDCYMYAMLPGDPRRDTGAAPPAEPEVTAPDFSAGLVTAVAVDAGTGEVLMVAHMNEDAYRRTRETGHAWFWSRSRERLWEKGETSGNRLDVESVTLDCDGDAVLLRVSPHGPACHTGARSCFHNPAG